MKRGEVWWVDFEPATDSGVRKNRPAVIVSNNASQIERTFSRPTWSCRLGAQEAKRLLRTGQLVDDRTAKPERNRSETAAKPQRNIGDWSMIRPAKKRDAAGDALARRMAEVPKSQLAMQKRMINQAYSRSCRKTNDRDVFRRGCTALA